MGADNKYCVYRHTTPSGTVYIGITGKNPHRRWNRGAGYKSNKYFSAAIAKYGWDNITHEILYSGLSKQEACEKEIALIQCHRSNDRNYGYNHSSGGEHPYTGCCVGEETKRKMSEAHKGRKKSADHCMRIGKANRKYNIIQMALNGDVVAIYPSTKAAADAIGCAQSFICLACNGSRKTAKNFKWKYEHLK